MDRFGMQGAAFLTFLSCSVLYLLSCSVFYHGGPPDLSTPSSPSYRPSAVAGSISQQVSFSGIERLRLATVSGGEQQRRRLLQSGSGGYIGYGALSGDNVPCPPQSGRSYYTPNCQSATGPVDPYSRGCSTIANCARG